MNSEQNEQLDKLMMRAEKQSEAISRLTYDESIQGGEVSTCCKLITEALVDVLDISQSSVWFFSEDQVELKCQDHFSQERDEHTSEGVLPTRDFPRYIRTIKEEHLICSSDVSKDENLSELLEIYFLPQGILSTFEISIWATNQLVGIICCEEKKHNRKWNNNEKAFCKCMASLVGLCITNAEQKQFIDDLKRKKKLLDNTEKIAKIGSWEWDVEKDHATWSDELFRIFEYPKEKGTPGYQGVLELLHPSCVDDYKILVSKAIKDKVPYETAVHRITRKNETQHLVVHAFPEIDSNGEVKRLSGSVQDITLQLNQANELQEKEQLYESILSAICEGLVVQNLEDEIILCNESACQILHLTEEQLKGKTSFDPDWKATREDGSLFPPEEHPSVMTTRTGKSFDNVTMRVNCGDQKERVISINSRPVFDNKKRQIGAVASFSDITERKRAEEQLIVSEERNRAIISAIPDMLFMLGEDLRIIQCYAFDESLLTAPISEITGKPLKDFIPDHLYKMTEDIAKECRKKNEPITYQYEIDLDDSHHTFEARMVPSSDTEVLVISRDITERIKAQEAMQRVDRLESLGTLAGGIAHDFNNILMGFFLNVSLAREELEPMHPATLLLIESENCLTRARGLTQQLLTFSKGGEPIRQNVELRELIEEVSRFDLSGSNVIAEIKSVDDLWEAFGDRVQLEQVFSNLIVNANQSMPEGGRVYIDLDNYVPEKPEDINLSDTFYLKITVRDEGGGIPQKYLNKIFDPFFTTKQTGSGLGLATVFSIINKHSGHIEVSSVMGKGTEFTIFLPASRNAKLNKPIIPEEKTPFPLQNLKVLLLEDQTVIAKVVERMLSKGGATVTKTFEGSETTRVYRESFEKGEPYDIVIMDLTIPGGMGGKETVKELLKIDPQAKCIVSSGYAEDPVLSDYESYGFKGAVIKPYTKKILMNVLDNILSSEEQP